MTLKSRALLHFLLKEKPRLRKFKKKTETEGDKKYLTSGV